MLRRILGELLSHAPFTLIGAVGGVAVVVLFQFVPVPGRVSELVFEVCHPLHVLLSALVTAGVFRLYKRANPLSTVLIGVVGAIGIGTISDSLLPWLGEHLLGLEHAEGHIGFIDLWYWVWPAAIGGVALSWAIPHTKVPHAGHVLLSTAASLGHILMDVGPSLSAWQTGLLGLVLAAAVWIPCCASDILFPLLFVGKDAAHPHAERCCHWPLGRSCRTSTPPTPPAADTPDTDR